MTIFACRVTTSPTTSWFSIFGGLYSPSPTKSDQGEPPFLTTRVDRFFLVQHTKPIRNIPNGRSTNIPNDRNVYQMAIKYTNKVLLNISNLGFLVCRYTIWQPCWQPPLNQSANLWPKGFFWFFLHEDFYSDVLNIDFTFKKIAFDLYCSEICFKYTYMYVYRGIVNTYDLD
jgi:hypothetical protein